MGKNIENILARRRAEREREASQLKTQGNGTDNAVPENDEYLTVEGIKADIKRTIANTNNVHCVTLSACEGENGVKYLPTHQSILNELVSQLRPIDFREKVNLDDKAKVARKLYVVVCIEEILNKAKDNNWGLCTKNGFIYIFNGMYWQPINAEDFKTFLSNAAIKMGVPPIDAKYHAFRDELFKQFIASGNLTTPDSKGKVVINLLNGTFEFTDGNFALRSPQREDFIKYQLPFEYDPDADYTFFDNYIKRVLPDEDCRKILAEFIGYIFVNNLKLEKALLLYGSGANGKSVFFDIINALLGNENVCSYSLQNLTKHDGYQRAELSNKLLNYASEINGRLETSIFKQLVSGEPVEARQIYGSPFMMHDYAKMMFNCNELPKEVEQTNAYFRRFIIIPFSQTIPESEQDPNLAKKIIEDELSGVFNWVLDGLKRLLVQKKFTQSTIVNEQLERYKRETDSVAMFIDDSGFKKDDKQTVSLKDFYDQYKEYCKDNGYRICSSRTFSERIHNIGFEKHRRNQGYVFFARK